MIVISTDDVVIRFCYSSVTHPCESFVGIFLLTFVSFLLFSDIKMNKDGGPGPTNPMLYDPIPEGSVQTTKVMQFIAATAG